MISHDRARFSTKASMFLLCSAAILLAGSRSFAQVAIVGFQVHKLLYYPGEEATVTVLLQNRDFSMRSCTVEGTLKWDLDKEKQVYKRAVTLEPRGSQELTFSFAPGDEEYGREIEVAVKNEAGGVMARRSDYFSVAGNFWKVSIRGHGTYNYIKRTKEEFKRFRLSPEEMKRAVQRKREEYSNCEEFYAWQPGDFFGMTPKEEWWWSATGPYLIFREEIKKLIELFHEQGIRVTTYANPFATGRYAFTKLQESPEWFIYDQNGRPRTRFDTLSYNAFMGLEGEVPRRWPGYVQSDLNFTSLQVVDRGIEEVIGTARMFGFDGVRWDNYFFNVEPEAFDFQGRRLTSYGDPDEISRRNVKRIRKKLKEALGPNFVVGHNLLDYEWFWKSSGAYPYRFTESWKELARGEWLVMDEAIRHAYLKGYRDNPWRAYADKILREGEKVRALGGHYLIIGLDQCYLIDEIYKQVFTFAGRAHCYGNYDFVSKYIPGQYSRFATRYSALLWDIEHVRRLEAPEKLVSVQSDRQLWWRGFATVRDLEDGGKQYIIHLINPPVQECILTDPSNQFPPRQENVKVTFKIDPQKVRKLYFLTAEPTVSARKLSFKTEVMLHVDEHARYVNVEVPAFTFWGVVVLETPE